MATKQHFWSDSETTFMLDEMKDLNILQLLDGRKYRNADMFKKLSDKMALAGFSRSVEQIRTRWKVLRQSYFRAKRQSSSGVSPLDCPYFDILEDLLGPIHFSATEGSGVDVGFQERTPSQPAEDAASSLSSPECAEDTETRDIPVETESVHLLQSAPQQRSPGSKIRKKKRKVDQDHYSFLENLQRQHQQWLAEQTQQQQERDERFISSLMAANAQATERVVSLMLEGLQKMITPHVNSPHCSTELHHPAQNGISNPRSLIKNEDFEDYETG
ncbi:myb/SANT-like DNA-binding domain-containing protein 7 [Neoarius graeffei]|uniref:myb/SANT-like DNA-binding domain-containing protein 7 n=1 Tax=Neoarius graeffei TaxID=443677 RepID=UPI00298CDE09|nr:myb/SANT-like DNA-binding domain-containing protein 7 [Neoarius graeffei]